MKTKNIDMFLQTVYSCLKVEKERGIASKQYNTIINRLV